MIREVEKGFEKKKISFLNSTYFKIHWHCKEKYLIRSTRFSAWWKNSDEINEWVSRELDFEGITFDEFVRVDKQVTVSESLSDSDFLNSEKEDSKELSSDKETASEHRYLFFKK